MKNIKKFKLPIMSILCAVIISIGVLIASAENNDCFYDMRSAALSVREQIKNRNEKYVFTYEDNGNDLDLNEIMNIAFEHTGKSDEGDYLMYNCIAYTIKSNAKKSDGIFIYTITFSAQFADTLKEEKAVDEEVQKLLETLNLDSMSDYEKVKTIYDYMVNNITYDYDRLYDFSYTQKYSAYSAIHDKKSICQGYSLLFYKLALEENIDARIISSADHAWNLVLIGNKYYYIDTTWDAGQQKGSYFLKSYDNFVDSFSHIPSLVYRSKSFLNEYAMGDEDFQVCDSHNYSNKVVIKPTCVKIGYNKKICSCGDAITTSTASAKNHNFKKDKVTSATCISKGNTKYICSSCGEAYYGNIKGLAGHKSETSVTKATRYTNGKIREYCSTCGKTIKTTTINKIGAVSLSQTEYNYSGKIKKPTVTVKDSRGNSISKSNYTLTYSNSSSKKVGKYTVTVKFKSNYYGSYKLTYSINPTQVTSLKAKTTKKGAVKLTWVKSNGAEKYEIYYSLSKNGIYRKLATTAQTTYTNSGLVSGRTYYFKVRSYSGSGTKIYSSFTSPISVKVK